MNRINADESKKDFFRQQRIHPTGSYTEYVVRTFYQIYKACRESFGTHCSVDSLDLRSLCFAVYADIYDEPDHDWELVMTNCIGDLERLGYLSRERIQGSDVVAFKRPLDFLLEGEHEHYLQRYGIIEASLFLFEVALYPT